MGGDSKPNYLLTPPLVVNDGEVLVLSAKKDKKDSGSGISLSFGSSDSTFVVERLVYSHDQWVRVADLTAEIDTVYKTFTISGTPAGEYRFRFRAGGTVFIDSIAGFHLDSNAPDIYVLYNNTAARAISYGMPQANSTESLAVVNTGTGTLQVGIALTNSADFALSSSSLGIAANDTAVVDVTYLFNQERLGTHQGIVTFAPTTSVLAPLSYPLTAYSTYADAWTEDFEPEFIEDETLPRPLPEGWATTGWEGQLCDVTRDVDVRIKTTNVGIGAGYGYNYVPARGWLLHLSALPTFIVFSKATMTVGDSQTRMRYHFPEAIITGRGAAIYQWRNMFLSLSMVFNFTGIGHKESLAIHNSNWRVRATYGLRLGKVRKSEK